MQSYLYIQTNSRLFLCFRLFIHYTLFDSGRPNILSRQEFNYDGLFKHLYEEDTQYKTIIISMTIKTYYSVDRANCVR